jgi:hypothetical protein
MPSFLAPLLGRIGLKGGVIIALCLALAFVCWRADTFSDRLERSRNELAAEKAGHAVTRASLDKLEVRLAMFIAEGQERQESARRELEAQRERSAALDSQIARLRASRPTAGEVERCETPGAVIAAEGL